MKRYLLFALVFANVLLLGAGFAMAMVAYPRLPSAILLWINLVGQPSFWVRKTPLFFLYPGAQLFFSVVFSLAASKPRIPAELPNERMPGKLAHLWKEEALTALIFINLLLIHLQRSLIFLSHGLKEGINPTYFLLLFIFLWLLIPAYRLRRNIEAASRT